MHLVFESAERVLMKLLICIAFHYKEDRLTFLSQILKQHKMLADQVHVLILTNTDNDINISNIRSAIPSNSTSFLIEIVAFLDLPNPWMLTWAHKDIMRDKFLDLSYTHFLYTEDDIELTRRNIDYWILNREILREKGLYPCFLRVEWSIDMRCWTSTDLVENINLDIVPCISLLEGTRQYFNSPNPYQGLFFYDRELMAEHLNSSTSDIKVYGGIDKISLFEGGGGVAERANFALTFHNIPFGFTSRTALPYFKKYNIIDPECFIHHLPDDYANRKPNSRHGKISTSDLIARKY